MRKAFKVIYLLLSLLLVSGCWDSRTITDKTLVNGISFDLNQDKKIEVNALILDIIGKGAGVFEFKTESVNSVRDSVSHAGMGIQSFLPGDITTSKTRVLLLGEEFSKTKFIDILSTFRRRTFSNLNVSVAITNKQPAKNVLAIKTLGTKPLSFTLKDTIKNAEATSLTQKMQLFNIFTIASETGIDFTLPVVDVTPTNHVEVIGAGLIHNDQYTGHFIDAEQSPLLLMMVGQYGNTSNFNTKLPERYKEPFNTVSYEIIRPRRKLSVSTSKNKIDVKIKMNVNVRINEMTTIKMLKEEELQSTIQKDLNKRAKEVIKDIQLANSDVLGIGRYLKEHHPEKWRKLNWDKEFPKIKIHPKIKVTILSTGAIGKESQLEE
ncbi:Ger(x)C family spore germination protein [Bacillus sp. AFS055030]|uniref:Ger(x)C family spore germination protein n=1 Tax=Bacillus sp. AFS055030 TaxID=2033507 RepID=UPI000BFD4DFD|nr:Ger(x)C family spore germination protein [Bacillus sp. AFS055030]PGL69875.1 hypothetical protein CN925_14220 [Bacillus sp. AFS055030]